MALKVVPLLLLSIQGYVYASQPKAPIDVVIGVDGGTESIRACCFDAQTGSILGKSHAVPYVTSHPNPGWAEQDPLQWYDCLVGAVKGAVGSLKEDGDCPSFNIRAICADTTCCSVVALSKDYTPLRPCLLWMDARSAPQAKRIMDVATEASAGSSILEKFPELRVNSNGEGPISAEWLLPKAMWIKETEPEVWEKAHVICEYQDYINYRLTNRMVASSCNAAVRWHHDGWEVLDREGKEEEHAGRPMGLYKALGISELANKLPKTTLAMGDVVGGLSEAASKDLGLPEGTLVVQVCADSVVRNFDIHETYFMCINDVFKGRTGCICWNDWSGDNSSQPTLSHYWLVTSALPCHTRASVEIRDVGRLQRSTFASFVIC